MRFIFTFNRYLINKCVITFGLIFIVSGTLNISALAQTANQNIYLPPNMQTKAIPNLTGAGPNSAIVTPGDAPNENISSGSSVVYSKYDTHLKYQNKKIRPRINLLMNGKVVLTFQPDQLTSEQKTKISLLGKLDLNEPYQNILVTESDLIEIQNILAPYPETSASASSMPNGIERKQIISDANTSIGPATNATTSSTHLQNTIRKYCRYLVILAVVFSCIFMVFAAIGMQFGDRNAAGRIISTLGGLMLILMSFSIWKVIMINQENARGEIVNLGTSSSIIKTQSQFTFNSCKF
jgi:hypothetical protein